MSRFWMAYLYCLLFWLQFPLGCVAIFMLHNLTGGNWGKNLYPVFRIACRSLQIFPLLLLPFLWGARALYPWIDDPEVLASDRHLYLNFNFFVVRSIFYVLLWAFMAWLVEKKSTPSNAKGPSAQTQYLSAWALVVYFFSASFAAFDWMMSLEPPWNSSVYGLMVIMGQGIGALAWLIFYQVRHPSKPQDLQDLGNLSLAFVMTWAYLSFMQYLIIWSGNLPAEAIWYLHRTHNGWAYFPAVLSLIGFFLPFLILLSRRAKRDPKMMLLLAGLMIVGRILDLYWLIFPAQNSATPSLRFYDVLLFLVVGGAWWLFMQREKLKVLAS